MAGILPKRPVCKHCRELAGACSTDKFMRLMKTGNTANGMESASGLMTQMGRMRFSLMTGDGIHALKRFLDLR